MVLRTQATNLIPCINTSSDTACLEIDCPTGRAARYFDILNSANKRGFNSLKVTTRGKLSQFWIKGELLTVIGIISDLDSVVSSQNEKPAYFALAFDPLNNQDRNSQIQWCQKALNQPGISIRSKPKKISATHAATNQAPLIVWEGMPLWRDFFKEAIRSLKQIQHFPELPFTHEILRIAYPAK